MLFPLTLLLVAGLFFPLSISSHPTNSPPAKRLTPLEPRKVSSLAGQTVLSGLLVSRQGDGQCCGTSDCCNERSLCCDDMGCCDIDENCCEGGSCCPENYSCAVADNGDEGCCPIGQDCSGSPNECDTSGYVPCSNENFCCPPAQICSRDSNNSPTCIAGGSQTPIQTVTPTTDDSGPPNQPTGTSGGGSESQNQGLQNVTIDLSSEAGITWSGDWVSVGSSCSSSGHGRSLSGDSTDNSSGIMAYSFAGPSVYLSLSGNNTQYTVSIDGEETSFTSPSTQSQSGCTIGWSRTDMASGNHTLQIKVSSVSDLRRRQEEAEWAFDILNLIITADGAGLFGAASSNVASWPLVVFSALVCISPYL
ncbi:hypothetical protein K438DRAFT_1928102 [Mycena galopus ATCC 62051]|nr:hypothetical protein K438DRAFT_1928102 [Mycena galopus ATCC 62051]